MIEFVENITIKLQILCNLLKVENKFVQGGKDRIAFNEIKKLWKHEMEFKIRDMEGMFVLQTDASQFGLGACLMQYGDNLAFISRTLTGSERYF